MNDIQMTGGITLELQLLKLLADETRWRLLQALRHSDHQVGELVLQLRMPQNLVSYHLGLLRQAGLVRAQRSTADARTHYYGLDVAALDATLQQLASSLQLPSSAPTGSLPVRTVVFLCTGNSARSQMAEGWLRQISGGRVIARSAGTHPQSLHPLAVAAMAEVGVDIGYQQAKDLSALEELSADVVVTVCDLAREACPSWQEGATHLHWSTPDPALPCAQAAEQLTAFRDVRDLLRARVGALLTLLAQLPAAPTTDTMVRASQAQAA